MGVRRSADFNPQPLPSRAAPPRPFLILNTGRLLPFSRGMDDLNLAVEVPVQGPTGTWRWQAESREAPTWLGQQGAKGWAAEGGGSLVQALQGPGCSGPH